MLVLLLIMKPGLLLVQNVFSLVPIVHLHLFVQVVLSLIELLLNVIVMTDITKVTGIV